MTKTILLSGATGAVGSALVQHLLDRDCRLAVAVRHGGSVAALRGALPEPHHLGVVEPSDAGSAAAFVAGVEDGLGPIDAFVSTAGAFEWVPAGEDAEDLAARLLEANFLSVHTLVRALIPRMRARNRGAIAVTGAAAVGQAGEGMALYTASKAALHEYVRALGVELEPHGITCGIVSPGIIDTPANREAMPDANFSAWESPSETAAKLAAAAAVDATAR